MTRWAAALPIAALLVMGCAGREVPRPPQPATVAQSHINWWPGSDQVWEHEDSWVLKVVLDTGDKPAPETTVPFRFELLMRMFYDARNAGPGPVVVVAHEVEDEQPHSITQDVCFRTSKTSTGRFLVPIRIGRGDGFRPGEYDVRVVRADTGEVVGKTARVTLH